MQELKQYTKKENHLIVGKFNDGRLTSFGVADLRMELITAESFRTAYDAMIWGDLNYKSLV